MTATPIQTRIASLPALMLLIALPIVPAIAEEDALLMELRAMATDHVLPLVNKRGGGAIAVGGFTAAASVKGSAGPEIQLRLSEILQALDARLDADDYRYEITGNYLPYRDPDSGLQGVKLVGRMVDAEDGTTLGEFPRFVFGAEAVPRLLGLSVSGRSRDPKRQSALIRAAMKKPTVFVVGAEVAAAPSSEYAMEILVQDRGRYSPRPIVRDRKSRPFVEIHRNEVYAIRLLNHSRYEAAVKLTIDGVNVFAFTEQKPRPQYWIVPPKQGTSPGVTEVRGWDKSQGASIEFKVVDFPDSAAARVQLKPSAQVGLITASFAPCWKDDRDRPRGEGRARATGFGNEITDHKAHVRRQIGGVRDVISIRYERSPDDSIANNR